MSDQGNVILIMNCQKSVWG